jgi:hypothetical protein
MVITQSKTYWGLIILTLLLSAFLGQKNTVSLGKISRSVFGIVSLFILAILLGLVATDGSDGNGLEALTLPFRKFLLVLADQDFKDAVIGKRMEEAILIINSLRDSVASILFGKGLGYIYRDISLFYYRSNLRDLQQLSMFSHNYILWLILKFGLLGLSIFVWTVFLALRSAYKGNSYQKCFAFACVVLLMSSLLMGSLENPTAGFLFGILLSGAAYKRIYLKGPRPQLSITNDILITEKTIAS